MNAIPENPDLSLDIIVPIYNEQETVEKFHRQLCQTVAELPNHVAIYYVNDGSNDNTGVILKRLAENDNRVVTVELSRNYGHQAALTAGLDVSSGEAVITMDGDGQNPPELIPEMLSQFLNGYDMVLTKRIDKQQTSFFKRWTSEMFYRLINRISNTEVIPGGADFRLLSRGVVDELKKMREYHRFLRGMVSWMGFRTVILPYVAAPRIGGKSKYTSKKMFKLAMDAIFSFSLVPLQIGLGIGILFLILALAEGIYVLSFWLRGQSQQLAPGWSSLMFMLLIVGGSVMTTLGMIGIYVGYIFQEVKNRPIYLISEIKDRIHTRTRNQQE